MIVIGQSSNLAPFQHLKRRMNVITIQCGEKEKPNRWREDKDICEIAMTKLHENSTVEK